MLDFMVCVELDQLLKLMNDTHRFVTCDQIVDAVTSRTKCDPPSTFMRNMQDLKHRTQLQLDYLADMGLLATDETDPQKKTYIIANTWNSAADYNEYAPDRSIKARKPTSDDKEPIQRTEKKPTSDDKI